MNVSGKQKTHRWAEGPFMAHSFEVMQGEKLHTGNGAGGNGAVKPDKAKGPCSSMVLLGEELRNARRFTLRDWRKAG